MEVVNIKKLIDVPYGALREDAALKAMRACPTCEGIAERWASTHVDVRLQAVHHFQRVQMGDDSNRVQYGLQVTTLSVAQGGVVTQKIYSDYEDVPLPVGYTKFRSGLYAGNVMYELAHEFSDCPPWFVLHSNHEGDPQFDAYIPLTPKDKPND